MQEPFHPELFGHGSQAPVVVFGTNNPSEAFMVKGLLESNGLHVVMNPSPGVQALTAHMAYIEIMVPADQAADARQLLDAFQEGTPEFEGGGEGE